MTKGLTKVLLIPLGFYKFVSKIRNPFRRVRTNSMDVGVLGILFFHLFFPAFSPFPPWGLIIGSSVYLVLREIKVI